MNAENYQNLIQNISSQIAQEFLNQEINLAQRAMFLDADIAEITRQTGLETTKKIYEELLKTLVSEKKRKGYQ